MEFVPLSRMKVCSINNMTLKLLFLILNINFNPKGIKGTYQGLTATIMKQGSNQAIRFYVMETMKDWYRGGDSKKPVPKLVVGAFGAIAGAASVFGNTPIDVVKTRMQVYQKYIHFLFYIILKYKFICFILGSRGKEIQKYNGLLQSNLEKRRP